MTARIGSAILILIVLSCFAMPVSAVLLEVTYQGTVTALDPGAGTVSITASARYGCTYTNEGPRCDWRPITPVIVTCPVPDSAVFNTVKPGDRVEATSMGGEEGTWIAIARLENGTDGVAGRVTDLFGDPRAIESDYAGDYSIETVANADCSTCYGTRCTARSATVTVRKGNVAVINTELTPGESAVYTGEGMKQISVTFVQGQAGASSCPGAAGSGMIGGIQPVSVFIIHITTASGSMMEIIIPSTDSIIIPDLPADIAAGVPDSPVIVPHPVNTPALNTFQLVLPEAVPNWTDIKILPAIPASQPLSLVPVGFPVELLSGVQASTGMDDWTPVIPSPVVVTIPVPWT
jgi:hypothetical protein